jgi:hypothetical protein
VSRYLFFLFSLFLFISCHTLEEGHESVSHNQESSASEEVREKSFTIEEDFKESTWLERAESAWFDEKNPEKTDYCLDRVERDTLINAGDIALYQLLCRKIYTKYLPLVEKGFTDKNISSLYVDGDDLWMGTWAGGVARYSLPLNELTVIRESKESLRVEKISDFESQGNLIRLAGYSDLYSFEKRTSRLNQVYPKEMERINDLAWYKGQLYASTVNKGLWYEGGDGSWSRIGRNITGLNQINTLYEDRQGNLLIGTVTSGIISYNGVSLNNFQKTFPNFTGGNVTSLAESEDLLLVGTYGEGGYIIDRIRGESRHYSKSKGDFQSDYLLCVLCGDRWAFAGTLGGGLYALDIESWDNREGWIPLGMDEGLNSLDAAALILYDNTLYVSLLEQGILMLKEDIIEKAL